MQESTAILVLAPKFRFLRYYCPSTVYNIRILDVAAINFFKGSRLIRPHHEPAVFYRAADAHFIKDLYTFGHGSIAPDPHPERTGF